MSAEKWPDDAKLMWAKRVVGKKESGTDSDMPKLDGIDFSDWQTDETQFLPVFQLLVRGSMDDFWVFRFEADGNDYSELLMRLILSSEGKLRDFFVGTEASFYRHFVDKLIVERLMHRYDLVAAAVVVRALNNTEGSETQDNAKTANRLLSLLSAFWLPILVALFVGVMSLISWLAPGWLSPGRLATLVFGAVFWGLIGFTFLVFLVVTFSLRLYRIVRLSMPRMWGGIAIGYLALASFSDLFTRVALGPTSSWAVLIGPAFLVLSYSYFYLEIMQRRRLPDMKRSNSEAFIKSLLLTLVGLSESLGIGLLFAQALPWLNPDGYGAFVRSNLGMNIGLGFNDISLRCVWLYATAALFIGVVLQVLWEEKPVTGNV